MEALARILSSRKWGINMKIVIDIPDKAYGVIKYFESALDSNYEKGDKLSAILIKAVLNGIPLPKGHGDLIDRNGVLRIQSSKFNS